MKRVFSAAIILSAFVATLFWSCAKDAPDIATGLTRKSFDAWIRKNAPNAVPYRDIYIEFIEKGPSDGPQPIKDNSWLSLDYTGRTLDGVVIATRDEEMAKRIGTFAYSTHFTPDFTFYQKQNTKLCKGLQTAMEEMRRGDSVRIYIPSDQAYSTSIGVTEGYAGEANANYSNVPVIFNMRLNATILSDQIQKWELDSVERYAKLNWGTDYTRVQDTFGLFVHVTDLKPEGDPIGKDSIVYVYFEERFFDNFLSATNIEDVAIDNYVYDDEQAMEGAYQARPIRPGALESGDTHTQKALYLAVLHMRKGEKGIIAASSHWVYGNEGNTTHVPEIQPYHPMLYYIEILEKAPEGEGDLE